MSTAKLDSKVKVNAKAIKNTSKPRSRKRNTSIQLSFDDISEPKKITRIGRVSITDSSAVYVVNPETNTKIGVFIKKVTPEYAQELLVSNHIDQRTLKEHIVESYVRAMASGLWSAGTGEPIKFSAENGDLLDGQHRLTAVVRSGKPIYMMFMTGILEENIRCIDNGASRNLGDVLRLTKNTKYKINTNSLASFIRQFHLQRMKSTSDIGDSTVRAKHKLCSSQAVNLYEKLPHIENSIERYTQLFSNKLSKRMPQSVSILMFYLFYPINNDITFSILKTLEHGIPFDSEKGVHSPAWTACEWITNRKMNNTRFKTSDYVNAFVWAFDMMINGKSKIPFKNNENYIIGKNHAGCDQIFDLFKRIKY